MKDTCKQTSQHRRAPRVELICTGRDQPKLRIRIFQQRLLPGGPSSSEGSTVGPTVLSLAILNNLVLTMSSQIGSTLAKRRMQKLESLHYYVLSTLFPLPVHLDDQCGEFLESWMAYQEFNEFPDLIEYYTTIENDTLLKEEYTTIKECTLLKDIGHFLYLTQSY